MKLRLLKILFSEEHLEAVEEILDDHEVQHRWSVEMSDHRHMMDAVVPAAGNEPLLDDLESALRGSEDFRLLFFPLEATVPRIEEPEEEEASEGEGRPGAPGTLEDAEKEVGSNRVPSRINREELYSQLKDSSQISAYYLVMVALSAVVASSGLLLNDGAVIIGAMVIAPLIGPNIGLAFATTLGDLKLGRTALLASVAGVSTAFVVSLAAGWLLEVDPSIPEILGRTRLTYEHLALALAAGAAGALSMSKGVGVGLVGVMVAVALLPPLAAAGLLLGNGSWEEGMGALVLVAGNVVCVNLAATTTFLVQGVRPNTWWEEGRARKAVWIASILWGALLVGLLVVVWIAWGGEAVSVR